MIAKAPHFFEKLPPPTLIAVLAALTLGVGYIDYITGTDTTFSGIYLFPIAAAAWFGGRVPAYGLAIASSVLWLTGDIAAGARYPLLIVPLWNIALRFAVFAVSLEMIAAIRKLHTDVSARAEERAAKLTAEIAAREKLERELLQISEREQRRVGQDIHDGLCQHLTGTAFAGQVLAETLRAQGSALSEDALRIVELVEQSIALSRSLARGLNAVNFSSTGLMEALEDFSSSTSDLFKISCRFECPLPILIRDSLTAGHLFRIAQEAVGNAIKHGRAKEVLIQMEISSSGTMLCISDDGAGLPPFRPEGNGMGLRIMSYRAEVIGAKLSIRARPGGGTSVTCLLPRAPSDRHEQDEIENRVAKRFRARA
jgi:signal transduction histidine kinase